MSALDVGVLLAVKVMGAVAVAIALWRVSIYVFESALDRTLRHTKLWRSFLAYMRDRQARRVPLYCPKCGEEVKAVLWGLRIEADPVRPCLWCPECGELWRVELWPTTEERKEGRRERRGSEEAGEAGISPAEAASRP